MPVLSSQLAIGRKLTQIFDEARSKNAHYSLRAFSRKLQISPAALSEILSGRRRISFKMAEKLAFRLSLTPDEWLEWKQLFETSESPTQAPPAAPVRELTMDQYALVAEWYHFAILSLAETHDFQSDERWIAHRLGIKLPEVQRALARLRRLGLLTLAADGTLVPSGESVMTPDEIASLALRRAHAYNLELARRSLERNEVHERDFVSMTMAIDPHKLPAAKQMIRKFRQELSDFLESGTKSEVYKVTMNLFPLTDLRKEK